MSYPYMKFDNKSPITINDEFSSKEEEEQLFEKRLPVPARPVSAKNSEFKASKTPKKKLARPTSASKNIFPVRNIMQQRRVTDPLALARLRPKNIPMDKERLYDENMALKMKINSLSEDIVILKTKLNQSEREIIKKEGFFGDTKNRGDKFSAQNLKSVHLITSLKQTIKELRLQLQAKDEDIMLLRKNLKSTKQSELEVEIQAYIDECTRLRHHLEEVMQQRDAGNSQGFGNFEEQNYQQLAMINNLKKENAELTNNLNQTKEEALRWREKATELERNKKKRPTSKKTEINNLKTEIQHLKMKLTNGEQEINQKDSEAKSEIEKFAKANQELAQKSQISESKLKEQSAIIEQLRTQVSNLQKEMQKAHRTTPYVDTSGSHMIQKMGNPPKLFKLINQVITKKRMLITVFLSLLDTNNNGYIEIEEFIRGMKLHGQHVKKKHIEDAMREVTGKVSNFIHLRTLEDAFERYEYSNSPLSVSSGDEMAPAKPVPKAPGLKEEKKELPILNVNKVASPMHLDAETPVMENLPEIPQKQKQEEAKKAVENKAKVSEISPQKPQPEIQKKVEESKIPAKSSSLDINPAQNKDTKPPEKIPHPPKEIPPLQNIPPKEVPPLQNIPPKEPPKPIQPTPPKEPETPTIKVSQITQIIKHISMRMQLNRLPKNKLMQVLFGSGYNKDTLISKEEIREILSKAPLNFSNEAELDNFCRFLVEPETDKIPISVQKSAKASRKDIGVKLYKILDEWDVFSQEDENDFDEQLYRIISKHKDGLKKACKAKDPNKTGLITLDYFCEVLKDLKIEFPPKIMRYMTLLFYSNKLELNSVPYKHFIKAYKSPPEEEEEYEEDYEGEEKNEEEEEELTDESRAKIVRHYLEIIAEALKDQKKAVRDAFKYDKNGFINPDSFIEGLKNLGIDDIEDELLVLIIESLQYEEETNEMYISVEELEEILEHYGVPIKSHEYSNVEEYEEGEQSPGSDIRKITNQFAATEGERIKKVSMLESSVSSSDKRDESVPDSLPSEAFSAKMHKEEPAKEINFENPSQYKAFGNVASIEELVKSQKSSSSSSSSSRKSSVSSKKSKKSSISSKKSKKSSSSSSEKSSISSKKKSKSSSSEEEYVSDYKSDKNENKSDKEEKKSNNRYKEKSPSEESPKEEYSDYESDHDKETQKETQAKKESGVPSLSYKKSESESDKITPRSQISESSYSSEKKSFKGQGKKTDYEEKVSDSDVSEKSKSSKASVKKAASDKNLSIEKHQKSEESYEEEQNSSSVSDSSEKGKAAFEYEKPQKPLEQVPLKVNQPPQAIPLKINQSPRQLPESSNNEESPYESEIEYSPHSSNYEEEEEKVIQTKPELPKVEKAEEPEEDIEESIESKKSEEEYQSDYDSDKGGSSSGSISL
ncbi:unnamed protein product [Blepharisma stoltei]|uniref:EF-hand domain-containing protein n=1 Tax=Blepharisma stoltei TaxID=1481888 RepID=A0AAU9JR10_9CILI|nr:unnamed protein product [Blepharisma stoltei]